MARSNTAAATTTARSTDGQSGWLLACEKVVRCSPISTTIPAVTRRGTRTACAARSPSNKLIYAIRSVLISDVGPHRLPARFASLPTGNAVVQENLHDIHGERPRRRCVQ